MKQTVLAFIVLLFALARAEARETYAFDPNHSVISFTVHQYLGTTRGRFWKSTGKIEIDREHPENSSVSAVIEVASIDTGIKKRDDHLRSSEFFNAAQYPEISFKSKHVTQKDAESAEVMGDLTMHGVTRPVVLHVKLLTPVKEGESPQRTRWLITTEPLRRSDFNLVFAKTSETISGISQDVAVKLEIEAAKQ